MLVLTRKTGEWITIGNDIRIRVVSMKGDQVQLGVEAPRDVPVHRGEIFDQIRAELERARSSANEPGALDRLKRRAGDA